MERSVETQVKQHTPNLPRMNEITKNTLSEEGGKRESKEHLMLPYRVCLCILVMNERQSHPQQFQLTEMQFHRMS